MVKSQNDHKILVGLISLIGHERDSHVMDDGNVVNAPTTPGKNCLLPRHSSGDTGDGSLLGLMW